MGQAVRPKSQYEMPSYEDMTSQRIYETSSQATAKKVSNLRWRVPQARNNVIMTSSTSRLGETPVPLPRKNLPQSVANRDVSDHSSSHRSSRVYYDDFDNVTTDSYGRKYYVINDQIKTTQPYQL